MPDLIRHPASLVIQKIILDSGFRRNDGCTVFSDYAENVKMQNHNRNLSSTEGDGFQPSPKGIPKHRLKRYGFNCAIVLPWTENNLKSFFYSERLK
jgi:hypothetical protein